jgi:DNA-binding MarR family transcriptional regulator
VRRVQAEESQVLPLSGDEEAVWRALARVVSVLPRIIDNELMRDAGLTLNEYVVLMTLSEAPDRSRRMSELAETVLISASGLTRLVERLERDDMVARAKSDNDGRSQVATLTDRGLERLQQAWPAHLASVRRVIMSNLAGLDLPAVTASLNAIVDEHGDAVRRPGPRKQRWAGR